MENKQKVTSMFWRGFLGLVLMIGFAGHTIASTPDGETPANEGVCDVLQGGTPGLYGLCVAYCEAQDLDMMEEKGPPNTKILANYRKKMRAGDPDMPCLQTPCPCWTADELAGISASSTTPVCRETTSLTEIRVLAPSVNKVAGVNTARNTCFFNDSTTVPPTLRTFAATAEELQICRDQVLSACAALGQ